MQKKTRLSLFKANTFFWQTLAGLIVAMTLSGFLVFAVAWGFLNPDHTLLLNHPGEDRVIFAEEVVSLGGKPALTSWLQNQNPGPDHARVYAVDSTDHDLGGHKIPNGALERARALVRQGGNTLGIRSFNIEGEEILVFTARKPVNFFKDSTRVLLFAPHGAPLWLTCIISLLVASAVAAGLAWRLTRPLRQIEGAMVQAASGDLNVRISESIKGSSSEFIELAKKFDMMAATIQQLIDRQQNLFHSVSHELRSPLARINCAVELARRSPDITPKMLDRIESDVQKLDSLVGDLLTYTRLNAEVSIPFSEIDVSEIVEDIADNASLEGDARKIQVICDLPKDDLIMTGNADLLAHAIENVVRNALRFSPDGGKVTIQGGMVSDSSLQISVQDEGPGIPQEEMAKIFDPFFRGANQATGSGYGLGLPITMQAAQHHGGTVHAENILPHGLKITITLPLKPAGKSEKA